MGLTQTDIRGIKEACQLFGIDYEDFINKGESSEEPKTAPKVKAVEKAVTPTKKANSVDYKALYEKQLEINQTLVVQLGNLQSSISNNFSEVTKGFTELTKGLSDLEGRFDKIEHTPAHSRKSIPNLQIVEKSFQGNSGEPKAEKVFNLRTQKREVKEFLGQKMMEEFSKGIQNGFYENAAMTLDANGILTDSQMNTLLKQDKILITL